MAQSWLHIAAPGLGPDRSSVLHNPQARPVLRSCTIATRVDFMFDCLADDTVADPAATFSVKPVDEKA